MRTPNLGARAFIIPLALAGAVLVSLAPAGAAHVAATEPTTEAQQIIKIARKQLGDPWRYAASGPNAFDCSGLITYAFTKAGAGKAIGNGKYRSARALYRYFKSKGLADRKNPKPGDLVIWGGGTHVGIYIGKGKAISTLTTGVRIHSVKALTARFTAYLHTGMWETAADGGPLETAGTAAAAQPVVTASSLVAGSLVRSTEGIVNLRSGGGSLTPLQ